ncbi:MAG: trypsin-like serine protease [Elusimicrobiota bacterium]|nr:trypsin-like serine protease [Elusimicrobiota bacterium]
MRRTTAFSCVALLSLAAGAASGNPVPFSILGGVAAAAGDPPALSTVWLLVESRVTSRLAHGETWTSYCSGVLVARDAVLTAAHCFPTEVLMPRCVNGSPETWQATVETRRVTVNFPGGGAMLAMPGEPHPRYAEFGGPMRTPTGPDLAVVLLPRDAPAPAVPAALAGSDAPGFADPKVVIAGYGGTRIERGSPCGPPGRATDPQLRRVALTPRGPIAGLQCAGNAACDGSGRNGAPSAWHGDSGGPVYDADARGVITRPQVVGVITEVAGGATYLTDTRPFAGWVADTVASLRQDHPRR